MCGIAGIVAAPGEAPAREVLEAMGEAIKHRGPDDGTVTVWRRCGFSFRRLSIIDVAGGRQPIDDESGSVHVVLNGEIYNYKELRDDLERRGHRFKTQSDVECVVHGYEVFGDAVVERLRGMFALALWDEQRERLLLARDRLGKKPLVYRAARGRLSFASELQSLLRDPAVPRRANLTAIHHYLTFQYVPAPLTAFEEVQKLPPGHRLVFEKGAARVEPYWTLPFREPIKIDEADAASELRRLLRDAVKVRLMSEVPLGAFLSGGIDSSTVVALMSEFGRAKTFSIGFEEQEFDELRYARMVAERYGTDHHEFVVRPNAAEVLPKLVQHYGEPFADSSAVPTYYVSKIAREHVTVALNGDGGDELFAGYDRYKALRIYAVAAAVPGVQRLGGTLADVGGSILPARAQRLLRALSDNPEEGYARTVSYFTPEEKQALYADSMTEATRGVDSYQALYERYREWSAGDLLARTLYVDTMTYLPGDLLVKVDVASMAVGLEGRSPFLDHPLVEFAASLPSASKLVGGRGKHVLRRAVDDLLPAAILDRPKMGFGVPISSWFRGELREFSADLLLSRQASARGWFRPDAVTRLWEEHQATPRDRGNQLWSLVCLELWSRAFLDARAA
jgi:asparagine synthase (glutamine-hydrolysing)